MLAKTNDSGFSEHLRTHNNAFDDDATQVMGEAYDTACMLLGDIGPNARKILADHIIEQAARGERDPIVLLEVGMAAVKSRLARNR